MHKLEPLPEVNIISVVSFFYSEILEFQPYTIPKLSHGNSYIFYEVANSTTLVWFSVIFLNPSDR